jgi:Flp pilus assembly protein TadG
MIVRARQHRIRRGATIVETALVLSIFFMFLFGVLEYARFLLALQVSTNASRDGARYASINVREATDFDVNGGSGKPSIDAYVTGRMGGVQNMLTGFEVEAFPCNAAQLYADPPVIAPKPGWTNNPATRTVHWNSAIFTERIGVRVRGNYSPILPNFLFMGGITQINIVSVMGSEG